MDPKIPHVFEETKNSEGEEANLQNANNDKKKDEIKEKKPEAEK